MIAERGGEAVEKGYVGQNLQMAVIGEEEDRGHGYRGHHDQQAILHVRAGARATTAKNRTAGAIVVRVRKIPEVAAADDIPGRRCRPEEHPQDTDEHERAQGMIGRDRKGTDDVPMGGERERRQHPARAASRLRCDVDREPKDEETDAEGHQPSCPDARPREQLRYAEHAIGQWHSAVWDILLV